MNLLNDFARNMAPDLLVRITLILAAAWLIASLFRQHAAARHAILLAGISSALLLPVAMLTLSALSIPRWNIEMAADVMPVSTENSDSICPITTKSQETCVVRTAKANSAETTTIVEPCDTECPRSTSRVLPGGPTTPVPPGFDWQIVLQIAIAVWVAVAVVRSGGLALSLARLRKIVLRARTVDSQPAQPLLARIQRRVGLPNSPEIRESSEVSVPIAAGVIGNYILVPAGWISRLTQTELYSVLCHEAAHLARRDHRVVILQEILSSLLWFHPLVHLVNRALTRAREEVCDNYAICSLDRPAYCAALFRLAGGCNHNSLLAATSLSNRHWPLEERIRGILDERRPTMTGISRSTRFTIFALALGLCCLTAIPALTAAEPESTDNKAAPSSDNSTDNVDVRRIRVEKPVPDNVRSIRIASEDGSVAIRESGNARLEIEAIVRVDAKQVELSTLSDKIEDYVQITSENGALAITPKVDVDKPNAGLSVDLVIAVPAGLAIEAQTRDGDIAVDEIEAKLTLTTHDGDIAVKSHATSGLTASVHDGDIAVDTQSVAGNVALSAHDGDVTIRADAIRSELSAQSFDGGVTIAAGSVAGPLNAVSHDGDVTVKLTDKEPGAGPINLSSNEGNVVLEAQAASKVAANTVQGPIVLRLTGSGVQEGLAAATSEGDVTLEVARETNADLALITREGSITIEGQPNSGKIISTRLGKGGPKYAIATNNGSITIKQIED